MRSYLIAFCCCLGFWLPSGAQNIDTALARYSESYGTEKLYLHYDKATYAAGETVWFKAYLMEGLYPALQSKTLYIDWIGEKGEVLSHHVLPLVDGTSNGQFEIPVAYKGTAVHVRGYTRWMLNFDSAFLYTKDIRVIGTTSTAKAVSKPVTIPELTFFPEGGDAIAGLTNRIAFKATDQWGQPVKIRGVIEDAKGAALDSFRSVHDGMGSVFFLPQSGATYTARWKDESGKTHTTPLPPAKAEGLIMQVRVAGAKRVIALNASPAAGALKQLHMIGTLNSTEVFRTDINLDNSNSALRSIVTTNLPTGILTITVFDAAWNAVAERITFINNHNYSFEPQLEVQHWGLNRRARNEVKIAIPDSIQSGNLSISVTDVAIDTDSSQNIISGLLLTSDLRGRVHNPAYYFSSPADSIAQNLDLVMLTNGWRRFKWEDLTRGKLPVIKYPKDTAYLSLSGKLYGVTKGMLSGKDNIVVFLTGRDSAKTLEILPIKTDGSFNNPGFVFFDTLRVYYHLKSKFFSNAEARFMPDRLAAPNYSALAKTFNTSAFFSDTTGQSRNAALAAENQRLLMQLQGKMMETVTVTAKAKKPIEQLDEKYSSGLFKGGDAYQFDLVNDPFALGQTDVIQYLQGKVPGLQISGSPGAPTLSWRGGAPQFFLDEISVDAEMITSLPISDIAYVKVFRPPFYGGMGGGSGGGIAIYTRKGSDQRSAPGSGLSSNVIAGYSPLKEFYSPNYESANPRNEQRDLRTTLYWNPFFQLNAKKRTATIRFFNNDVTKAFRVVIEGMTPDGLLTHYETILE